jgi:NitT/TauT family transport system permease protein
MPPDYELALDQNVADRRPNPVARPRSRWIEGFWLPVVIVAAWELAAAMSWLDPLFFPPPSRLLTAGSELLRSGDFREQIQATLFRAGGGFLLGAFVGIACGVGMGALSFVRRSLEPLVSALYNTPKLALLPMLMLMTGTGETPRLILVAAAGFLQVAMHTLDGVRGINGHYLEMAANHGAGRWLLLRRVYLPACAPQIFTGLRLGIGRSLVVTISVELVTGATGLGSLVWRSWQTFAIEQLYIAVITTALLGATIHKGLRLIEARLIPWGGK